MINNRKLKIRRLLAFSLTAIMVLAILLSGATNIQPVFAGSLTISGSITVDGQAPGANNIFTFQLSSADGTQVYQTTQNNANGIFSFNADTLANGNYRIREVPTDTEKENHTNMVFDESEQTVTLSGQKSTTGADWLKNGNLYMAYGGSGNYGPILVKNTSGTESVYAYCLENGNNFPSDTYYHKTQYKAIFPVDNLSGYTQKTKNVDEAAVKKLIYHYTVNPPQTTKEWDNVELMIAYLTSGTTISGTLKNSMNAIIASETVPSNFTLVVLIPYGNYYKSTTTSATGFDENMQNLITGFVTGNRNIAGNVQFANTTKPDNSLSVTISGKKTLDGSAPGKDNIFSFELCDSAGNRLQTTNNNGDGEISFEPITYDTAGTYTYTVREVNDGREGITFDTNTYTVEINVGEEDLYDLSGDTYYSVGINQDYYMSVNPNTQDFPVYCIDEDGMAPQSPGSTSVTYSKIIDPDSATLANYVKVNYYGDQLAENLRKLYYYIEVHYDELRNYERRALVWAATGTDYAETEYAQRLDGIFAEEIPADYHLVLFIPDNFDKTAPTHYQTLMGGLGSTMRTGGSDAFEFKNTGIPSGYILPETGGSGLWIFYGTAAVLLLAGGLLFLKLNAKQEKK